MPQLGLGTWLLRDEQGTTAVRMALDMGYTHIDTARLYENHAAVARGMAGFDRADIFLVTKVWHDSLAYDDVLRACASSLEELQTDYLDLFLIHWPDPRFPMLDTFRAFAELVGSGRVRSVGVSNFDIPRLEEALALTDLPIVTNQVEFHALLYQEALLNFCRDHGIVLTAYCPLGRGVVLENEIIRDIAPVYDRTPGQVALRWLVNKGCAVIPKASSEQHLRANMDIFDWELRPEDERRIDAIDATHRVVALDL
jgi:diketogulonate reductase-like aldo/keto reductase